MNQIIKPVPRFRGKPKIPGDKSISHRSLIFGALAEGKTEVTDILESGDVQSTAQCLRDLGVKITKVGNKTFVEGVGAAGFRQPSGALDCGNSGTTIRLMMGVLSGSNLRAPVQLIGDGSLTKRPMKRVAEPLRKMGATFTLTNTDYAPLTVTGTELQGIDYQLKIASAQIKSAIILAGLHAKGVTTIRGEIHSRDHTERMLDYFGVRVEQTSESVSVRGGQKLTAHPVHVPGDPSTAAFWMAAACLIPGAEIEMENIALNPTRIGFINVLKRMGADIRIEVVAERPEPVGRVTVRHGKLKGTRLSEAEIPTLIDELPLLAVLATQAHGTTEVVGAEELRVKESDRIEAVATNLRAMGGKIEVRKDGYLIEGPQSLRGATLETFHDHRIAMAFSIAGMFAAGETVIKDAECASISYPEFYTTLKELSR